MKQPRHGERSSPSQSAKNTFTALALDRVTRRRQDATWIEGRLQDPSTRFLPVWRSKVLVTDDSPPQPGWLRAKRAGGHLRQAESVILLGQDDAHAYFAVGLPDDDGATAGLEENGAFRRLRAVAALLDEETAALLAYAKAMVHDHRQHQFCGTCGAPMRSTPGGHLHVCTNPQCGRHDFPRTDPAIIVLVSSGERCLLGRQPSWPERFYSIIAGFVEPGENLEAAVAREVWEETGVQIENVLYHSSQPWPFPRSLMVGFTATASTSTIRLNDGELEDARWLSRADIVERLSDGTLQLPSSISVSHRLIEAWFDAEAPVPLKGLLDPSYDPFSKQHPDRDVSDS